jgi:glutamate synthase (NADPH/NADH) large chain
VAVLGDTGKNFAAGMSGGVAYVYDPEGDFESRCNTEMVRVSRNLTSSDERAVRRLVENHAAHTGSDRAAAVLSAWEEHRDAFAKVMPDAYRDAIAERPDADARNSLPDRAGGESIPGSAD